MSQPSPIVEYADALTRELSFDVVLSRRVRAEVEDHLWEAADNRPTGATPEAQRLVIASFGDPRELARQYVAAALAGQIRQVGAIVIFVLLGIFAAMKGRVAWYGLMQWQANRDWSTVSAIGLSIDRYAFMLAFCIALIGCGYIATRRIPVRFDPGYSKELNRCVFLCAAAAGALLLVVVTETILTGIRLSAVQWDGNAAVPALSLAAEIAGAWVLLRQIQTAVRRKAAAWLLFP
jgi:hypothetical protein